MWIRHVERHVEADLDGAALWFVQVHRQGVAVVQTPDHSRAMPLIVKHEGVAARRNERPSVNKKRYLRLRLRGDDALQRIDETGHRLFAADRDTNPFWQ